MKLLLLLATFISATLHQAAILKSLTGVDAPRRHLWMDWKVKVSRGDWERQNIWQQNDDMGGRERKDGHHK